MPFESVRWGVPNVAAIIAIIAMPLISFAIPDEPPAGLVQVEDVEFKIPTITDFQLTYAE